MVGHLCKTQGRSIQSIDLRQSCGNLIRKGCCSLAPAVLQSVSQLSHIQLAKVLLIACDSRVVQKRQLGMMRNSATDDPVEDTFVKKTMLHHVARAIVTTDDIFLVVYANIDRLQHHLTTVRTYDKT